MVRNLFGEGVMISNGPLGSSLPMAQGLALADAVAGNDRTTVCVISDGAMMEGEAKEAVSAIPGFAGKGQCNPFVLILSDNNTKLSGRIDAQAFSMQPSFAALAATGWNVVVVEDGHDLQAVYTALEGAVATAQADAAKAGRGLGQDHQGQVRQEHRGQCLRWSRISAQERFPGPGVL